MDVVSCGDEKLEIGVKISVILLYGVCYRASTYSGPSSYCSRELVMDLALAEISDALLLLVFFTGPPLFMIAAMLAGLVFNDRNPLPEEIAVDEENIT